MDISNKTLGLLLVAAIVVSVGGTFFSLDKLDGFSTTGYATDGTGAVNLSINTSVSIKMNDSVIDFGTCTIPSGGATFSSNNTAASANNTYCNGTFPDLMTVENDGNTNADVVVSVDGTPSGIYANAATASMDFKTESVGSGCATPHDWTTFVSAGTDYSACGNLTTPTDSDQFNFYVRLTLPDTATNNGDTSMGITFTASAS